MHVNKGVGEKGGGRKGEGRRVQIQLGFTSGLFWNLLLCWSHKYPGFVLGWGEGEVGLKRVPHAAASVVWGCVSITSDNTTESDTVGRGKLLELRPDFCSGYPTCSSTSSLMVIVRNKLWSIFSVLWTEGSNNQRLRTGGPRIPSPLTGAWQFAEL
jgi:hypothetical protein